ncbi:MAG: hypothetical protein DRN81_01220 [Thermoproteota archaeon]|nr:MAG: hypothetical protein DRN81_01220 [Candidatus Korarchaeota archaeon]
MNLIEEYRPYKEMRWLADEIESQLQPHCDRINIVGDIRCERKAKTVDILCIPTKINIQTDLLNFGPVRVEGFINLIRSWQKIKGDPLEGKYTKRWHPIGTMVNIYMATNANYGFMMMMRTGPVNHTKRIIKKIHMTKTLKFDGGYLRNAETNQIIPTIDEKKFYKIIDEPWVLPLARL